MSARRPGESHWPQEKIDGLVIAAARDGKRVVRLKSGDPLVFGRAAEEAAALDTAGIAWEVVPGVTAALAAAAEARFFPTERGVAQHFLLSTAAGADGSDPTPATLSDGMTVAYYMGVAQAEALQSQLLSAGTPPKARVEIVEKSESSESRRFSTTLDALAGTVRENAVRHPAILFVQCPLAREASSSVRQIGA